MNIVVWARVSSREQREGYSIDAQLRTAREKAHKAGWHITREFVVAESAKRGAERVAFNEMFQWVKANARRSKIETILSHKLDRVCRNLRDAVRLQDLEDSCGVKLSFVENEFGPGASGLLSFNVMAAFAQYYSDNLRSEVIKGLDEKVRQGWPTGAPSFGYMIVKDKAEPVQPHPERSKTVVRIFELYASGSMTFASLADQLEREGHVYRPSMPRFHRTALSYVINNRLYIGEIHRNGQVFPGRYKHLIDRTTFDACQDVIHGRNRRTGNPESALAGGLFRCAFCGQSITGEHIQRKLKCGGARHHHYYRCANNHPGPDHPRVRWSAADLEQAVVEDLERLRMPSPDVANWFQTALTAAFSDLSTQERQQRTSLTKRQSELKAMQDRLLNAYLASTVDEATFKAKSAELAHEAAKVMEVVDSLGDYDPARGDAALAIFKWSQNAAEIWRGSNNALKRDILDSVCLNRTLSDVSLVTTKRKPFDILVERPLFSESRGDRI
ncbi:MAG: recombinase family protein [Planctomycetaceae bacterium]|nr:recombinase family protein [Planctomycetaceae bacterium]